MFTKTVFMQLEVLGFEEKVKFTGKQFTDVVFLETALTSKSLAHSYVLCYFTYFLRNTYRTITCFFYRVCLSRDKWLFLQITSRDVFDW